MPVVFNMDKDAEAVREMRDRTRLIWVGIFILFLLMLIMLWMSHGPRPVATSVRAKHILISFDPADPVDRSRAFDRVNELRQRLLAEESFERLAREYSDDTMSGKRGGDLGWMSRGTFAAPFEEYVWHADIGKLSDIIQTQFGFHLIVVEDRHIADADLYEIELERRAFEEFRKHHDDSPDNATP